MKKQMLTVSLAFAAGAACAGVAAFNYKEALTIEDFQERMPVLLAEVADIGTHVAGTIDSTTYLLTAPPIACFPPPNPKMPVGAVRRSDLQRGIDALLAYNQALLEGEPQPARLTDKCHLANP